MILPKRIKLHHRSPAASLMRDQKYPNSTKLQNQEDQETAPPSPPPAVVEGDGLIPGLPDHVAQTILVKLPAPVIYSVSSSWRRLLYSPLFPPFPSLYILSTNQNQSHIDNSAPISILNYDPISNSWTHIDPPPLRLIIHHPSFLSRTLPIQSVSVGNSLILLAATAAAIDNSNNHHHLHPAFRRPLVFSPFTNSWSHGPAFPSPRRWCAAGALGGTVFMASGIGVGFNAEVARSVEKWDTMGGGEKWERLQGRMKDGRFCREAIEAVGWKRKLLMVNVKGVGSKEGAMYDVDRDQWDPMPAGLLKGWRGPAAAMEEELYAVDEGDGVLRRYEEEGDEWADVVADERLRGAERVAAGGRRVCVVVAGGREVVVVDVAAVMARVWVVEMPNGFDALGVHVLPRLSRPEFLSQ